ncbi:MAG: hypothetical protein KJN71_01125 [Acidimicrobiia bacterium]|nr:hypothetical protein [Acidimicrobiia bacterium]
MSDLTVRLVVVVLLVVAILLVSRAVNSRRATQRRITVPDIANAVVLFTSTDCSNCSAARAAFKSEGVAIREVTWELEPGVLEAAGVAQVPTAVVVGPGGETLDQLSGVPTARRVRRMAAMLGDGRGGGYRTSP